MFRTNSDLQMESEAPLQLEVLDVFGVAQSLMHHALPR